MKRNKSILWWGRFDPDYGRNRVIRAALLSLGWKVIDFRPLFSALGHWQAILRGGLEGWNEVSAVWVPCFRQRDFASAHAIAGRLEIPLIFDPLISTYDKQVFERGKFPQESLRAKQLLRWESRLFQQAHGLVADSTPHADYFVDQFGLEPGAAKVVPVGADEGVFSEQPWSDPVKEDPLEILFYGSFIGLQGPEVIAKAAGLVPEINWVMLGDGPLLQDCRDIGRSTANLQFEASVPYEELPSRIARADVILGIFGESEKAGRVIPHKVHQGMACGRTIVTRKSLAYPQELNETPSDRSGVMWTNSGDPEELAATVKALAGGPNPRKLVRALGAAARGSHEKWFGSSQIEKALSAALKISGLEALTTGP